ncbi:MAG TPA: hypothetical protein VFM54_21550 [Micromonosporaceae bacterium]|nr:hypothetical protein [Micromonosporaceae bacterium]
MTGLDDDTSRDPTPEPTAQERVEARARMRRKLAEARERHDIAYWARLRDQFGLPARTA